MINNEYVTQDGSSVSLRAPVIRYPEQLSRLKLCLAAVKTISDLNSKLPKIDSLTACGSCLRWRPVAIVLASLQSVSPL